MPVDGCRLVNPWGVELMYEATSDGARLWAEALYDLAVEAIERGEEARALWVANQSVGELLLRRYCRDLAVAGAVTAARDFCLARDPVPYLGSG